MKISLDMEIDGCDGQTLNQVVQRMKASKTVRLFGSEDEIHEEEYLFERAVRDGGRPTMGQTLAAWYVASVAQLDSDMYADDSDMTNRQYAARLVAIKRITFRRVK